MCIVVCCLYCGGLRCFWLIGSSVWLSCVLGGLLFDWLLDSLLVGGVGVFILRLLGVTFGLVGLGWLLWVGCLWLFSWLVACALCGE